MSKADTWENGLLLLVFNNTAFTLVGDAAGLRATTTAGVLYVSLHTADPGETGTQATSEAAYAGYARVGVARSAAGFTVTAGAVNFFANCDFPLSTGAGLTITHFGIGTDVSGAGKLLYSGTVTPNIPVGAAGVTPRLSTAANLITED